jgi:5'-nucleotidase
MTGWAAWGSPAPSAPRVPLPGPRVLITNDDGPHAAGLEALVRAAGDVSRDIVVAAPARDVSSTGTATGGLHRGDIVAWRSDRSWTETSAAFEVTAFPSAIVTLAMLGAFGPPPGLVLAGVNHGINVGRGLIHSATVGIALTAAVHGVPAVAFSAADGADLSRWHPVLTWLIGALPAAWPPGIALSVNLPREPPALPGELVWCEPAEATAVSRLISTPTGDGRVALRVSYSPLPSEGAGTDAAAVSGGQIACTSLWLPYARSATLAWQEELSQRLRQSRPASPARPGR